MFFPLKRKLYFLKLFGMYVFLSLMFDKCCVKCVFEKKVETSVSSNKITAFCKNENNKQEVESLHSYSTDNNYSITEKTKVFVEAIKWDEKEGLRQ